MVGRDDVELFLGIATPYGLGRKGRTFQVQGLAQFLRQVPVFQMLVPSAAGSSIPLCGQSPSLDLPTDSRPNPCHFQVSAMVSFFAYGQSQTPALSLDPWLLLHSSATQPCKSDLHWVSPPSILPLVPNPLLMLQAGLVLTHYPLGHGAMLYTVLSKELPQSNLLPIQQTEPHLFPPEAQWCFSVINRKGFKHPGMSFQALFELAPGLHLGSSPSAFILNFPVTLLSLLSLHCVWCIYLCNGVCM